MSRAPDWMLPAGISEVRRAQVERQWKAMPRLRPVPLPVDVSDAACFPNIAEAIEHARKTGDE